MFAYALVFFDALNVGWEGGLRCGTLSGCFEGAHAGGDEGFCVEVAGVEVVEDCGVEGLEFGEVGGEGAAVGLPGCFTEAGWRFGRER